MYKNFFCIIFEKKNTRIYKKRSKILAPLNIQLSDTFMGKEPPVARRDSVEPIYSQTRCDLSAFNSASEERVRRRTEHHRKAKINSVASSITANGTAAISRNEGTKGHNARRKSNEIDQPLIIHSPRALSFIHPACRVAFFRVQLSRKMRAPKWA